jgi:hypothetical protein
MLMWISRSLLPWREGSPRRSSIPGASGFTKHAEAKMAKDTLASVDVINVLRGGVYAEAEWENAGWRHQVFTQRIVVVIEFESESELTIITAWRKR